MINCQYSCVALENATVHTHALLNLVISDWQRVLDRSDKVGAVLMDLSKAFDCLPHAGADAKSARAVVEKCKRIYRTLQLQPRSPCGERG